MRCRPIASALALAIAAAGSSSTLAQTTARDAPGTAPQSFSPVVITASPLQSNLFDMADPVNVLQGEQLQLKQQPTLGETLGQEPGVSSTYFGPNSARPIVRGLGGFDIRLLNNGIGLIDASAASPDHNVAVSPFAVERIEVVRGPATVLYGGSAIGGVVNTIDSRIAEAPLSRPFSGAAAYTFDSQNDLSAGGARLDVGTGRFALHLDGYGTRNDDLSIPGSAWTTTIQQQRGEPGPSGTLPNSQGDSQSFGVGASGFLGERGDKGFAGLSYSEYRTNYGTVAEEEVTIDLKQQAWNFAGELRDPVRGLRSLRLKYGYNDYEHTEFEGAEAGTVFKSKGWNLRLEALHHPVGRFEGAVGIEAADVDFSALGEEAFVPSSTTRSVAGFLYEELKQDAWRFMFGGRVEGVQIDAQPFEATGAPAASTDFTPWSLAGGTFYSIDPVWGVGANLQYAQRAPSAQELFADGPHIATDQFEVGNPNLAKVASTSIDLALKMKSERASATLGVFYAQFSNYIGLFPTGIYRNPEDRSVAAGPEPIIDPDTGEEIVPMQQSNYAQVDARFYGAELQVELPVWQRDANAVSVKMQADYVHATDRDNGRPLPFIPPFRFGLAFNYQRDRLAAALGGMYAASQNRVPQFQTTTPSYVNVFANASYRWKLDAEVELEAFVQGTNLLDRTIRYSTSSLKDIAPAGARAVMAGVRGTF